MRCHPDNTAAKFVTELPAVIDLQGEWEVGLSELIYPRSIYNVYDGECFAFVSARGGRPLKYIVSIPVGYYPKITDLLGALRKGCVSYDGGEQSFSIKYDTNTRKVKLEVNANRVVKLSDTLVDLLGFNGEFEFIGPTYYEGEVSPYIRRGITSMYVYCDVIEPNIVGDSKVQLLRALPVSDDLEAVTAHSIFVNPIYVPLQKKHFGTIEINIMSDTGATVPFDIGKSVVVLHFRRSSNPYFLLSR